MESFQFDDSFGAFKPIDDTSLYPVLEEDGDAIPTTGFDFSVEPIDPSLSAAFILAGDMHSTGSMYFANMDPVTMPTEMDEVTVPASTSTLQWGTVAPDAAEDILTYDLSDLSFEVLEPRAQKPRFVCLMLF